MKTISALIFSCLFLVGGFGLAGCQRSDNVEAGREPDSLDKRQAVTDEDKYFVQYASEMHTGEIEMAKQAKQKSSNKDIADYADAVIRVHSDALKQLSDRMGERVQPSNTASLDTKYHMEFLSGLSGSEFDGQFVGLMIADHKDAAETFREQSDKTQDRDMKDYLQAVLPGLENSLQQARDLQSKFPAQASNK